MTEVPKPVDLPPHLHERVVCSISAAVKYEIPANIVLGVAGNIFAAKSTDSNQLAALARR
jgi:hypothetical protein